jgi:Uma2 family endonuclease
MTVQEKLYTANEFWEIAQSPENENKRLELVGGVIDEMPPSSPLNTIIAGRFIYYFNAHVMANDLGYVTTPDGGFALGPNDVRQPDAAFISKARVTKLPEKFFPVAPDLAVEVISPSETSRKVLDKVYAYLRAGTRLVWAVYPEDKLIDVYRLAEDQSVNVRPRRMGDILDGEDVLPGFKLAVQDVFKDLGE